MGVLWELCYCVEMQNILSHNEIGCVRIVWKLCYGNIWVQGTLTARVVLTPNCRYW